MPDQWGRPTFNDGLAIMQTSEYFKRDAERLEDRAADKDAYKVADAIEAGGDISEFGAESRYKGAKLHWDNKYKKVLTETKQQWNDNLKKREDLMGLQLNLQNAQEKLRVYQAARASGNEQLAKQLAVQISNEHMFNGRFIEPKEGGYEVTNWDGSKVKFDDMPIEQVDQLLGAYFQKSDDEIMSWQLTALQKRRQKNSEVLSQAEPWVNEKTGQVIYKVPAGVWGPDGKPKGSFFVDSPTSEGELSPEQTKGFVKLGVAKEKAGLKKVQKEANRPDIVQPGAVVTQGGEAGLITTEGGQPSFKKIPGGLDAGSLQKGKGSATGAKAAFELKVKRLNTELTPFMDKGQAAIDPNTLAITNDGRNAFQSALKLVQKFEDNPASLTPKETAVLHNAYRAVQIYQAISEENRQAFGLGQGPVQQQSAAPPPGFVLDQ